MQCVKKMLYLYYIRNKDIEYIHVLHNIIFVFCYVILRYAPQLFLRTTMISIPKGGKLCSTNADLYRSIAISNMLSNILDYVIIDQQADSLATSDYLFGFKSHSSTMPCSTMLIKTIQHYDENGRQAVGLRIIMYYFWMQVKHSIVFVILSFLIFC